MTFSDSDWTRDPPLRARTPLPQRRVLILSVLIAVGCVAIAIAAYGIERLLATSARGDALKHISDVAISAPPSAGVAPAIAASTAAATTPIAAAPQASAPLPSGEDKIDPEQMAALEAEMRQRAREAAEQAAAEAARRKERAWQRFYQRPDFCADNPTAAQMVQCANQYIRARKDFEERYTAGRL